VTATLPQQARLPALLGHELRNPLAGALTNLAVAAELTDADDPRAPLLRTAHRELVRLQRLLDRCLEFARLGRVAAARGDLRDLLHEVAGRQRGGRVTVAAGASAVHAAVDRALLERALENLIENSLAAGAEAVELAVEAEPGAAVLLVRDDGPGVPAELRDSVFEPFVSGRGSHGLGLPFAREVVRAHGGTIDLCPDGRGAAFRIALPA
jgi:signal transduction histidine kinase